MERTTVFGSIVVSVFLVALPLCAQDPVNVDPKHYKLEFENDHLKVLRITYGPHEKSVMHDHLSGVAVFLTDHHVKFTAPDGKTQEGHRKAGETIWGEGGKHLPENMSDKPFELVLVELKPAARTAAGIAVSEDPANVSAKHCKVEFENDRVRVLRWKIGPGEKTAMHEHPANVTVLLTGGRARFHLPDGSTRETDGKTGQVVWSAAEKHASENLGTQATEVIQIELKG